MEIVPHWEYRLLMKMRKRKNRRVFGWLYEYLLRRYENAAQPVSGEIYGFPLLLNPGNKYPFIVQDTPLFNAPLLELTFQAFSAKGSPLRFVDIGAATGDTVFLLKDKCPNQVGEFICIEGDPEFFGLLSHNTARFEEVRTVQTVLSRDRTKIRSFVKHHPGTAAATGDNFITAMPLDDVKEVRAGKVDILKIDVDGFDGAVLSGAKAILSSDRPAVVFEWHPVLLRATGNDSTEAFSVLAGCGYKRYLWFTNRGTFSHFSDPPTQEVLKKSADYLVSVNDRADEHYDVIALPDSSGIDDTVFAMTAYARRHLHA